MTDTWALSGLPQDYPLAQFIVMVNWKLLRYPLACFKKVYGNRVWRGENCLRTHTKLRHRPWIWDRRQLLPGPCRERGQELSPRETCLEAWRTALPMKGFAERQMRKLAHQYWIWWAWTLKPTVWCFFFFFFFDCLVLSVSVQCSFKNYASLDFLGFLLYKIENKNTENIFD